MSGCIQIVYSGRQGSQCGEPTDGEDHDFCPYHEAPDLWDQADEACDQQTSPEL